MALFKGTLRAALLGLSLLGVFGCSSYVPVNQPLEKWDPSYGYRPGAKALDEDASELSLLLAFSGGGTRAAAFAYGVLQELRDTTVVVRGERKRLLDEVDLITSVSGGSFASAYFGLYGDRIFEDFEERFLRRNVEEKLTRSLFNPVNWLKMIGFFERTDLAIELYDREIFDGASFADLEQADGPFIQINATDIAVGNRFSFYQPQFDLLCSDLTEFSIARAVAASSAVPVLFSPITLSNFAGQCGFEGADWVDETLADPNASRRTRRNAEIDASYLDPEDRPYVHLVDGGVSDNVGLRSPLDTIIDAGGIASRFHQLGAEEPPAHMMVIAVDSEVNPEPAFSSSPEAPGLGAVVGAITGIQINRFSFETIELMDTAMRDWADSAKARSDGRSLEDLHGRGRLPQPGGPEGPGLLQRPAHQLRPGRPTGRPLDRGGPIAAAPVGAVPGPAPDAGRPDDRPLRPTAPPPC